MQGLKEPDIETSSMRLASIHRVLRTSIILLVTRLPVVVVGVTLVFAFASLPNSPAWSPFNARPAVAAVSALGSTATSQEVGTLPTLLPGVMAEPARHLAGIVMPPVVNHGAAPVRKPGTPDPQPTTTHVVVVDGGSGAVLFQRNADEPVVPASLTKIMTAIVALERGDLSDHVNVDVGARQMPGDSLMGLQPGFDVTFQDLLYGLLLPSGDDAALAIARYVAGSDEAFVRLMNEKARWLGLRDTHFANPHGLDASGHYSSPADMVAMARYAMQYPEFRNIVNSKSYDIRESNISYTIYNVNPLIGHYPGLDGVKTGLTDSAGKALVATAVRDGHRIYVAYMRSRAGATVDGTLLLNWAFESFTWPPDSGQAGSAAPGQPGSQG